jgi:endonuclease YncB( thermonuclease family)
MTRQTTCRGEVRRVVDGDTYVVLCDTEQRGLDDGARTLRLRLRDFSAREWYTAEGKQAKATAEALLPRGVLVDVVIHPGADTLGRRPAWLWVRDTPVGPRLAELGAVTPGAKMG